MVTICQFNILSQQVDHTNSHPVLDSASEDMTTDLVMTAGESTNMVPQCNTSIPMFVNINEVWILQAYQCLVSTAISGTLAMTVTFRPKVHRQMKKTTPLTQQLLLKANQLCMLFSFSLLAHQLLLHLLNQQSMLRSSSLLTHQLLLHLLNQSQSTILIYVTLTFINMHLICTCQHQHHHYNMMTQQMTLQLCK